VRLEFVADQVLDVASDFGGFVHQFLLQLYIVDFNEVYFVDGVDFREVLVDSFDLVFVPE